MTIPVGLKIYQTPDYGCDGQIGQEDTPQAFIERLTEVFMEVHRVLKPTGTLWVNIGDSYCGTGDKGNWKDPKNAKGRNGQSVSKTKQWCNGDKTVLRLQLSLSVHFGGWRKAQYLEENTSPVW